MKTKFLLLLSILAGIVLLTGCASTCSTCDGYYSYNSRCGMPSCTDQTYVAAYNDTCYGSYHCY